MFHATAFPGENGDSGYDDGGTTVDNFLSSERRPLNDETGRARSGENVSCVKTTS